MISVWVAFERLLVCFCRVGRAEAAARIHRAGSIACGTCAEECGCASPVCRQPARPIVLRAGNMVAWFVGAGLEVGGIITTGCRRSVFLELF